MNSAILECVHFHSGLSFPLASKRSRSQPQPLARSQCGRTLRNYSRILIKVLLVKKNGVSSTFLSKVSIFHFWAKNGQKMAKIRGPNLGHNFSGFSIYKLHIQHSRLLLTRKNPRNDTRSWTNRHPSIPVRNHDDLVK